MIPLLGADQAPTASRRWYRSDGSASPLTRSLATAPDVMDTLMPFLAQIMGESAIDLATKELVIVRVSNLNECRYCLAAHRPVALEAGVPEAQVAAVCDEGSLGDLPPREAAIVAWVDRVTRDPANVDEALVATVGRHLRDYELVELTVLAGAITMLNQYCTALGIPPPA